MSCLVRAQEFLTDLAGFELGLPVHGLATGPVVGAEGKGLALHFDTPGTDYFLRAARKASIAAVRSGCAQHSVKRCLSQLTKPGR